MLDLQQMHTTLTHENDVSQYVLATVLSVYPGRGTKGTDEILIDGGAICFSKDTGPSGSFGKVLGTSWTLGRISQEHGVLTRTSPNEDIDKLVPGQIVRIIGQHACLIAAAHPWYYVVDSSVGGDRIVDVWTAWKGW